MQFRDWPEFKKFDEELKRLNMSVAVACVPVDVSEGQDARALYEASCARSAMTQLFREELDELSAAVINRTDGDVTIYMTGMAGNNSGPMDDPGLVVEDRTIGNSS